MVHFRILTTNGDVRVQQYIKHKGDLDTLINFTDNRVRLDAGDINFLSLEKDASTPYPLAANNGGNRINFRVVDEIQTFFLKTDSENLMLSCITQVMKNYKPVLLV